MTALDNGNPRGGWNIIPGGAWGDEGGEREGKEREGNGSENSKDEGRWDRGTLLRVPLFRRRSYLPCIPSLVQSPPQMTYIFGRGARYRPIHFVIE